MEVPPLDRTQVHVWTASLSTWGTALAELRAVLVAEERARADCIRAPRLRRRFIVSRAILRRLLSIYLRVAVSELRLGYGAHGKPYVASLSGLCFNLSHAEDTVMYAFASQREVGIDIESTTRDVDIEGVARQAFSPIECEALTRCRRLRGEPHSFGAGHARKRTSRHEATVWAIRREHSRYGIFLAATRHGLQTGARQDRSRAGSSSRSPRRLISVPRLRHLDATGRQ